MSEDSNPPPDDGIPDLPDFLKRQKEKIPKKKILKGRVDLPHLNIHEMDVSDLLGNKCPNCGNFTDLVINKRSHGFLISCSNCGFSKLVDREIISMAMTNAESFSTKLLKDWRYFLKDRQK